MPVIDVWYDPARNVGAPALDSYLAAYVGERSRMNMIMMEQRLREADPTFLNEQITNLNNQLIRLQEARATIINTDRQGKLKMLDTMYAAEGEQQRVWMQGKQAEMQASASIQGAQVRERSESGRQYRDEKAAFAADMVVPDEYMNSITSGIAFQSSYTPGAEEDPYLVGEGVNSKIIATRNALEAPKGTRKGDAIAYNAYNVAVAASREAAVNGDMQGAAAHMNTANLIKKNEFAGSDPHTYMADFHGVDTEEERRADIEWETRGGVSYNVERPGQTSFDEKAGAVGLYDPDVGSIDKQIADVQRQLREAEAAKAALPKPEDVMFRGLTGNYLLDPVFTVAHADQRYIDKAANLSPMEREDVLTYMGTTDSPMEAVYKAGQMGGLVDTTQNVGAIQDVGTNTYGWVMARSAEITALINEDPAAGMEAYAEFMQQVESLPPGMTATLGLDVDGMNAIELLKQNYDDAMRRATEGDPNWHEELVEGTMGVSMLARESRKANPGDDPASAMWLSGEIAKLEKMRRDGDVEGYVTGIDLLYDQVSAMDPALVGQPGDAFIRIVDAGRESGDGTLMATNVYNLGKHTQNTYLDSVTAPAEKEDPRRDEVEGMRVDVEQDAEVIARNRAHASDYTKGGDPIDLAGETADIPLAPAPKPPPLQESTEPLPDVDLDEIEIAEGLTATTPFKLPDGTTVTVDLADGAAVQTVLEAGGIPIQQTAPPIDVPPPPDQDDRDLTDEEAILAEWAKDSGAPTPIPPIGERPLDGAGKRPVR